MKTGFRVLFVCSAVALLTGCSAMDNRNTFSIAEALNSPQAKGVLDPAIELRFARGGGQIIRRGLVSNKKTNGFGKSDEKSCIWAFLSAVKQFQERASAEGATKVVNLISYYKKMPFKSKSLYECHTGHVVTGVALQGDLAR